MTESIKTYLIDELEQALVDIHNGEYDEAETRLGFCIVAIKEQG